MKLIIFEAGAQTLPPNGHVSSFYTLAREKRVQRFEGLGLTGSRVQGSPKTSAKVTICIGQGVVHPIGYGARDDSIPDVLDDTNGLVRFFS